MGKGKLSKFQDIKAFGNVLEPSFDEAFHQGHPWKGKWREEAFANDAPLFLELACGKGEYTVELARRYPEMNFLGVDIKGNRIWNGAKIALEEGLENLRFLRTSVEFVDAFFGPKEVDGIWLTFPDPQAKKKRAKKRLTGHQFIDRYARFLKAGSRLHLKTDNSILYEYTRKVLAERGSVVERDLSDVHTRIGELPEEEQEWLKIPTFYEEMALGKGSAIKYIRFRLP